MLILNGVSARSALAMGVSLGMLNYCLRGLTELGFVRVVRFARSQNKLDYRYLLTPKGIAEKTVVTANYLARKEKEFESIQTEITALKRELDDCEVRRSK